MSAQSSEQFVAGLEAKLAGAQASKDQQAGEAIADNVNQPIKIRETKRGQVSMEALDAAVKDLPEPQPQKTIPHREPFPGYQPSEQEAEASPLDEAFPDLAEPPPGDALSMDELEAAGLARKPIPPQEQAAQAFVQAATNLRQEAADIQVQLQTLEANRNLMDPGDVEQHEAFLRQALAEHQRKTILLQAEGNKRYQSMRQEYETDLLREVPEWADQRTRYLELNAMADWLVGNRHMSREAFSNLTVPQVKEYLKRMRGMVKAKTKQSAQKIKKVQIPRNDYDNLADTVKRQRAQRAPEAPADAVQGLADRKKALQAEFERQGMAPQIATKRAVAALMRER